MCENKTDKSDFEFYQFQASKNFASKLDLQELQKQLGRFATNDELDEMKSNNEELVNRINDNYFLKSQIESKMNSMKEGISISFSLHKIDFFQKMEEEERGRQKEIDDRFQEHKYLIKDQEKHINNSKTDINKNLQFIKKIIKDLEYFHNYP